MKSPGLRQGIRLVRRHPRAAARVGRYAARHPRRAAMVVRLAREAPRAARGLNAAAKDPNVQRQLLAVSHALVQAPPKRRGRRGRRALVSLGAIGGVAYAAYRITRGRDPGPPSDW